MQSCEASRDKLNTSLRITASNENNGDNALHGTAKV